MFMAALETIKLFQKQPEPRHFKVGDIIFEDGHKGQHMYGIIEGTVELKVNGEVVETIEQGDVFGEGALVHHEGTRASTAVAKTDCTLAFIDKGRFLFAVQETPEFALEVLRSYSDRLRRLKRHEM